MRRRNTPEPTPRPLSACFGGGGFMAMAFGVGVVDGLAEAGIDVRGAPMLGTSGGAWAAGIVALGLPLEGVVDLAASAKVHGLTQAELTHKVFGDSRSSQVRTSAVDRRSGRLRILRGDVHGVANAVGASASAPGLLPAYEIDGRRYIDGGVYSSTAAHRSARSQLLVVSAPMCGPGFGPAGAWFSRSLRAELLLWRRRTGGRVLCVRADREQLAEVGTGMRAMLDPERVPGYYRIARKLAFDAALALDHRRVRAAA